MVFNYGIHWRNGEIIVYTNVCANEGMNVHFYVCLANDKIKNNINYFFRYVGKKVVVVIIS